MNTDSEFQLRMCDSLDDSPTIQQKLSVDQVRDYPNPFEALLELVPEASTNSEWANIPTALATKENELAAEEVLAYLCLRCMNLIPVTHLGYNDLEMGKPRRANSDLEEEQGLALRYARRSWINHILGMSQPPVTPLLDELQGFLANWFPLWIAMTVRRGKYGGISSFLKWLEMQPIEISTKLHIDRLKVSKELRDLVYVLNDPDTYEDGDGNEGRREEALIVAQDWVEILRQLCMESPSLEHLIELSESLTSLALSLSDLKHSERALSVSSEAVDILRHLHPANPNTFSPKLVSSLENHSHILSSLGYQDESLKVMQEALDIYRKLLLSTVVVRNYQLDKFAELILNISTILSKLDRHEESLKRAQKALDIHQQLAANNPNGYNYRVSESLHHLGGCLSKLKRHEEALAAIYESVEIFRVLEYKYPSQYTLYLAQYLDSLSSLLSELGHNEEALKNSLESVGLYRQLAVKYPKIYFDKLTSSLKGVSLKYSACHRHEEAMAAAKEATELDKEDKSPSTYCEN